MYSNGYAVAIVVDGQVVQERMDNTGHEGNTRDQLRREVDELKRLLNKKEDKEPTFGGPTYRG